MREASNLLAPEKIFENVGLQIIIGIIFLAIAYLLGNLLFIKYPKIVISNADYQDANK